MWGHKVKVTVWSMLMPAESSCPKEYTYQIEKIVQCIDQTLQTKLKSARR